MNGTESPDNFKSVTQKASKFIWINAVGLLEQYLSIAMCMLRFDYNVVLSFALLLYLELPQSSHEFKNREVCPVDCRSATSAGEAA